MKKFVAGVIVILGLAGCATPGPKKTQVIPHTFDQNNIEVLHKEVDNVEYTCLVVYVDGIKAGGPAMWCEREENVE